VRQPRLPGVLPLILAACSPGEGEAPPDPSRLEAHAGEGIRVVDDRDLPVVLTGPATRIVSLVPSFTSTLVELGALDQLAARTDFDTDPLLLHLPSVGGGLGPSREALAVARPDLVLGFAGGEDTVTPEWLDAQGVAYAGFRIDALADVPRVTRLLGELSGRGAQGDLLASTLENRLAEVERRAEGVSVRAAVILGGTPPWVAGGDSYLGELLSLAGGENVFADLDMSHGPVSPEVFLVRDLRLLLLMPGAQSPIGSETLATIELPEGIDIPGPELATHAEWLQRTLSEFVNGAGGRS